MQTHMEHKHSVVVEREWICSMDARLSTIDYEVEKSGSLHWLVQLSLNERRLHNDPDSKSLNSATFRVSCGWNWQSSGGDFKRMNKTTLQHRLGDIVTTDSEEVLDSAGEAVRCLWSVCCRWSLFVSFQWGLNQQQSQWREKWQPWHRQPLFCEQQIASHMVQCCGGRRAGWGGG